MKRVIIIVGTLLFPLLCYAEDVIHLKSGKKIETSRSWIDGSMTFYFNKKNEKIAIPSEDVIKITSINQNGKRQSFKPDDYILFKIYMRDGRVLEKKSVWEEDNLIKYSVGASSLGIEKHLVKELVGYTAKKEAIVIFDNEDKSEYNHQNVDNSLQKISKSTKDNIDNVVGSFSSYSVGQKVKLNGVPLTFVGCGRQTVVSGNSVTKGGLGQYFQNDAGGVVVKYPNSAQLFSVKPGWVPQRFESCNQENKSGANQPVLTITPY